MSDVRPCLSDKNSRGRSRRQLDRLEEILSDKHIGTTPLLRSEVGAENARDLRFAGAVTSWMTTHRTPVPRGPNQSDPLHQVLGVAPFDITHKHIGTIHHFGAIVSLRVAVDLRC